jgi:chorismate mutase
MKPSTAKKLQFHRDAIDGIDDQLVRLLAKRQEQVKEIGKLKKAENIPIFDAKRELDIRTKRKQLAKQLGINPLQVQVIFDHILTLSRETQANLSKADLSDKKNLIIGVMGGIGSFSEEAARHYLKSHHITSFDLRYPISAENVLKALDKKSIDIAIFPIENSTAGLVDESIKAMSQYNFDIDEIFEIDIRHCLHVLPGVKRKDIQKVMSHPQALRQCQAYLKKNFPKAELIEATDTAEGARILEQSPEEIHLAVIAPKRAGEIYHLETLEEGIQDQKINYTRFIAAKK